MIIRWVLYYVILFFLSCSAWAGNIYIYGQAGGCYWDHYNDLKAFTGRGGLGYAVSIIPFPSIRYGLEIGYQEYQQKESIITTHLFGERRMIRFTDKRQAFDLLAVLDVKPFCNTNFFVKIGPAWVVQKSGYNSDVNRNGEVQTQKSHDIVPKAVVGMGFNLLPCVNINGSLVNEFQTKKQINVISIMAGIKISFT